VKGIENIDIAISDTDKLIKNFHNSDDIRSPFNNTIIVTKLLPSDIKAVAEYNEMMMTCQGQNSNASSDGGFAPTVKLLVKLRDTLFANIIGSIISYIVFQAYHSHE
jgi:hypothetical protein